MPTDSARKFIGQPLAEASRIARECVRAAFREADARGIAREMMALELAGESFSAAFATGWSPGDLRDALEMALDVDEPDLGPCQETALPS